MKKVLFVCTANVCRSPTAEAIFNAMAEDKNLDYRSESAGTDALPGEPMTPNAQAALEEIGLSGGGHCARQVDRKMLEGADLVLTMSRRHVAKIERFVEASFRARMLSEYVSGNPEGVPDPYGGTLTVYRASARQLLDYVDLLVDQLVRKEKGA